MTPSPAPKRESSDAVLSIDWPQVLAEHDRWLRTVILARVGEPGAVDEVFQEVSLAAVRQKTPLRDPNRVAPWLYRIAVRQSLMYRRRRGRQRNLEKRYADQVVEPDRSSRQVDPLDWLLADERRRLVREALETLSPRDTEILLLKYSEGWTYHELAEHLGVSHSAVEARLHRARGRLRKKLTQQPAFEVAS
jgi:RNA polymerase sigma factor (sigma-70 family)